MLIKIILLLLIILNPIFSEKIDEKEIRKDKQNLRRLINFLRTKNFSINSFELYSQVNTNSVFDKRDLGNKIERIYYTSYGGYITTDYLVYYFDGEVIDLNISLSSEVYNREKIYLKKDLDISRNFKSYFTYQNKKYSFKFKNQDIENKMNDYIINQFGKVEPLSIKESDFPFYNLLTSYKESISYGDVCGFGATETSGRNALNRLLVYEDKAIFLNILKSHNSEGKAYALEGIYILKSKNINFSKEEEKLIEKIGDSKIKISVCGGCIVYSQDIKDIYRGIQWRYWLHNFISLFSDIDLKLH